MRENFVFYGVFRYSVGKLQFSIKLWYSDSTVIGASVRTLTDGQVDILLYFTQ